MSAVRYRHRIKFYYGPTKTRKGADPWGVPLKSLSTPDVGDEANPLKADKESDLRDRSNLDTLESLRGPRERDFYQDHSYFDQWEYRGLDRNQKKQIKERYPYFAPNYQITPWTWYPGDIVEVVSGTQTGQRGAILAVVPYKNELLVQNINVQDVSIPATDTRPEQVVSREHPISVRDIRHVDPTTDSICTVKFIRVKKGGSDVGREASSASASSGEYEDKRICMESGTILTTPDKQVQGDSLGDPLRDTPYADAFEVTYRPEEELPLLVERKLQAMEEGFVNKLKDAYEFHSERQKSTAAQMMQFQVAAQRQAVSKVAQMINEGAMNLDDWWFEELAPHTAKIEAAEAALAAERAQAEAEAANGGSASTGQSSTTASENAEEDDDEFEDDDNEEEEDDAAPAPSA